MNCGNIIYSNQGLENIILKNGEESVGCDQRRSTKNKL